MTLTTARDIREAVVSGKASAVEIARAALARIEQTNPTLNAFNHLVSERAIAQATLIDRQRAAGASLGPLAGAGPG